MNAQNLLRLKGTLTPVRRVGLIFDLGATPCINCLEEVRCVREAVEPGGIDLIQTYDPDLDDAIGGTVDQALKNIQDAVDSIQSGQYEQAADQLFGGYVQASGNDYGDWNVTYDMGVYLGGTAGDGCGVNAPTPGPCV